MIRNEHPQNFLEVGAPVYYYNSLHIEKVKFNKKDKNCEIII